MAQSLVILAWIRTWFEFPLLRRELTEAGQRRGTYVFRVLVGTVTAATFLFLCIRYEAFSRDAVRSAGSGRAVAAQLHRLSFWIIMLFQPAIACSAISGERERQTLGLLLSCGFGSVRLVTEKFVSRLMPMVVLLTLSTPAYALAYTLGGLSIGMIAAVVASLVATMVFVEAVSILSSAVAPGGFAALRAASLVLVLVLSGPQLLSRVVDLPEVRLVRIPISDQLSAPFLIQDVAVYQLLHGNVSVFDVLWACCLPLAAAAFLLLIAVFAVWQLRDSPGFSPGRWLQGLGRSLRYGWSRKSSDAASSRRKLPGDDSIAWRELHRAGLSQRVWPLVLTWLVLVVEAAVRLTGGSGVLHVYVAFDVVMLILSIGILASTAAGTLSVERDRQTLPVLLAVPLSSREILRQKMAAVHRLLLVLIPANAAIQIVRVVLTPVFAISGGWRQMPHVSPWPNRDSRTPLIPLENDVWNLTAGQSLLWAILMTAVYLWAVCWIAVLCALVFRSGIRSLVATCLSVISVCVVPFLVLTTPMLLRGDHPRNHPWVAFTTPALVYLMNEYFNLQAFHNVHAFIEEEWKIAALNAVIWSTVGGLCRWVSRVRLSRFLWRADERRPWFRIPGTSGIRREFGH